jgi:hypothetical protein
MRIAAIALVVTALAALVGAGTAKAAPVRVSVANCYANHGGQVTVAAGSDVTFSLGLVWATQGIALNFEQAQTTTASLNGSAVANASSLWAAPVPFPTTSDWIAPWSLSAGTLANAGDYWAMTMQVSVSRRLLGANPSAGTRTFVGPGNLLPADFGCTVTAVTAT